MTGAVHRVRSEGVFGLLRLSLAAMYITAQVHVMAKRAAAIVMPVCVQYPEGSASLENVFLWDPRPLIVISPFSKDEVVCERARMLRPIPMVRSTMVWILFFILCPNGAFEARALASRLRRLVLFSLLFQCIVKYCLHMLLDL